ncbi:MAG: IS630 family transposase, partial [Deltaproteobacteria bacterium]|nr:IS630 family transposase [Deltaproteobacteria bacterium]
QWLLRHPRFHLHFTPTHSSWLNQIELWFSLLQRRQLDRGVYSSVSALEDGVFEYIEHTNDNPKPFVWTKTADQILGKVARFCHRTLEF